MNTGVLRLFGFLVLACTLQAANAQGPHQNVTPRYKLTLLGPLDPAEIFYAADLNNRGELAGTVSFPGRAALWRKGQIIELVDPTVGPFLSSAASSLNDRGDVVGQMTVLSDLTIRWFFWHRGEFIDMGLPFPGSAGSPTHINNRRQILFRSATESGVARSYVWERGTFTALEPPPGGDGSAAANALNDFGEVAGAGGTANGNRAVLWRDGTVEVLGVLPNTDASRAEDINNRGVVVGESYDSIFGVIELPFVWRDGKMAALPTLNGLPEGLTEARSINDWGQIVGHVTSFMDNEFFAPLLWQNGAVFELNTLVRDDDPLKPFVRLRTATVINDRGQIQASGQDSRVPDVHFAYLLTPVL